MRWPFYCRDPNASRSITKSDKVWPTYGPAPHHHRPLHLYNLSSVPVLHIQAQSKRRRHIDKLAHDIRHHLRKNSIKLKYMPTKHNLSDILTNSLDKSSFQRVERFFKPPHISRRMPEHPSVWQATGMRSLYSPPLVTSYLHNTTVHRCHALWYADIESLLLRETTYSVVITRLYNSHTQQSAATVIPPVEACVPRYVVSRYGWTH